MAQMSRESLRAVMTDLHYSEAAITQYLADIDLGDVAYPIGPVMRIRGRRGYDNVTVKYRDQ